MTPTSPTTGATGQEQALLQDPLLPSGTPHGASPVPECSIQPLHQSEQQPGPHLFTQAHLHNNPSTSSEKGVAPQSLQAPPGLRAPSAAAPNMQYERGQEFSDVSPRGLGQPSQPYSDGPTFSQPYPEEGVSRASGTVSAPPFATNQEAALSQAQNGGQGSRLDVPCYYLMLDQQNREREAAEASADIAVRQLQGTKVTAPQQQQQQQEVTPAEDGMLSFATKDMDTQETAQPRLSSDPSTPDGYMGMSTPTQQVYQPLYEQQQQQRHKTLLSQQQQQQQQGASSSSQSPQWEYSGGGFAQDIGGDGGSTTNKDQQVVRQDGSTGTSTEGTSGSGTTPNSVFAQPGCDLSSSLSGLSTEMGNNMQMQPGRASASGTAWPSNIPGMEALMAANERSTGRLESASTNSSEQLVALHKFLQFARGEQQQQGNTRAVHMSYANETMHQPYPLEGQGPLPLGHQAAIQKAADRLRQRLPPSLPLSRTGSLEVRPHASSASQLTLGSTSHYMPQSSGLDSLAYGPLRASGSGPQGLARQQLGLGSHLHGIRSGPAHLSEFDDGGMQNSRGGQSSASSGLADSRDQYGHGTAAAYASAMTGQEQTIPLQHHQRVSSSPGLGDMLARAQHLAAFGGGQQQGGEPSRQVWRGGPGAPPMEGGAGRVNDSGRLMYGEVGDETASGSGSVMEPPEGKPSRHLWLGNIPVKPNKAALEELFGFFGPLESVRVFPEKTFAFVNYVSAVHAAAAKAQLDGLPAGSVTGGKPLVIRFQRDILILPGMGPGHSASDGSGYAGVGSPRLPRPPGFRSSPDAGDDAGYEPATNLSNRLNPNNIHFDAELANRYKRMSKSEKELLWAQDWALQQLLAHPSSLGGTNTILDISSATLLLAASGAALPSGLAQDSQMMHPGAYHPGNLSATAAAAAAMLTQGVGAGLGQQGRLRALQQQQQAQGMNPLQQPQINHSMFTPPFLASQPNNLARQHSSGPIGRHAQDLSLSGFAGGGAGGGASNDRQGQLDERMLMDMQMQIAGLNMQPGSDMGPPMESASSSILGNTSVRANLRLAGQVGSGSDRHQQQQNQQQQMYQSSPSGLQQRQLPVPLQQYQDPALEQQWQGAMNRSMRPPPQQAFPQSMGSRMQGFPQQGPESDYMGGSQQGQGVDGALWAQMLASMPPESMEAKRQMQVGSDAGSSSAAGMSHVQRYIHLEQQLQERQQQNLRQQQQLQQQSHQHMQQQLQQQQWGMSGQGPPHFAQVVQQQLAQLQQQRWLSKPMPPTFLCPLTWELMADPVVAADGVTYDRVNILGWLRDYNTSPVTNQPLVNKSLTINQALQSAIIDELVSRQQQQQPQLRSGNPAQGGSSSNALRQ